MEEDDDSEIAFSLQVEEALSASLLYDSVSSPEATHVPYDAVSDLLQNDHLYEHEHDLLDEQDLLGQYKAKRLRLDLTRQIHDRALACEIANMPEEDWRATGDHLNRPYGEGSSSSSSNNNNVRGLGFRVYIKGLMESMVGGVGVAVCDENDGLVFEMSKSFSREERKANCGGFVDFKALAEGLDVAVMLDLKRVSIVTDSSLLYQYVTGKNPPMKKNVDTLCDQIDLHLRNFNYASASLVASHDIKFAVELARNAIVLQVNRAAKRSNAKDLTESCGICFEDAYVDEMFLFAGCQHRYCFPCMSKHVQFKLLQGSLPVCPSENCKSEVKLNSCKTFLSPELFDILTQRMKEASIPAAEKIYCPYPKCSTLFSKTELRGSRCNYEASESRKCPKCSGIFCINCKVPWHSNMNCSAFKRSNPNLCNEDRKLKGLATKNRWRQCPKCNHMVSLSEGCNHIHCRCGHEFCYTCGASWKNKKATCTCPIWDERNIIYPPQNRRQRRRLG